MRTQESVTGKEPKQTEAKHYVQQNVDNCVKVFHNIVIESGGKDNHFSRHAILEKHIYPFTNIRLSPHTIKQQQYFAVCRLSVKYTR